MSIHNICFYIEILRKLSKIYHQILVFNKPLEMSSKHPEDIVWFCLLVMRLYSPVNPMGSFQMGQFT